ncbi:bifunctional diguanylate cyclase/phosphodiesterase [Neiella sp. HB171785]|uniref:Bifunctional diguanylate cyclase/phosphodiesterase n=1 Tax=Neiella litorisoli TaxID=2771431 RepID=A0A8J6QVJ4_9GAMM|nr:bifunctional diguanylate cyclase/phosphodiesterase [Neiella litorisoli]MBD1390598.1 bifunctional diguanylate cyclase/phosphodiesterase [Neiella litorisoli]
MIAIRRIWIVVVAGVMMALLYTLLLLIPNSRADDDKLSQQLDLISQLLARDIELVRAGLESDFYAGPKRPSDAWLEQLIKQPNQADLKLNGLMHRVNGKVWNVSAGFDRADQIPRKLETKHWLCQPSCRLLLRISRGSDELIADVDLPQWLSVQGSRLGLNLSVAGATRASLQKLAASSVEQDIGLYFSSRQSDDWKSASGPVLDGVPMILSGQRSDPPAIAVHWYVLLLLLVLTLSGMALLTHLYGKRQQGWRQLFRQLEKTLSAIESGNFEVVQKRLVGSMQHAPELARNFVRKLAIYGLQDEATKATLAQISNDKDWLTQHDGMTGLANRESFHQLLQQTIHDADSSALLLIDIDDFKEINDASGHQLGNDMLIKLASILAEHVQLPYRAARIAGDEFAVWMPGSTLEQGEQLAAKLLEASRQIMLAGDNMLHRLSLSIGVVVAPEHGNEFDVLMTRADIALNYSKAQGKGRYASLRDPDLEGYLLKQRFMYSRVHSAIRDQRLALAYQPIVRVNDGSISHYEVLLRIEDEVGSYVSAYPLIQAAERQRDVGVLDKWVLNQVLTLLMQMRRNNQRHRLAVNISGLSMSDAQLTETLLQRIEFSGCGPALVVEITESAALENISLTQRNIERLQALGCQVALDDFGVGYSSVNNLLSLPFDYVKVDGCFIRKLSTDDAVIPLLEFLVTISKLRGFQLVAEFVENDKVAQQLEQIGVQFAQGYHYGKPELGRLSLEHDDDQTSQTGQV